MGFLQATDREGRCHYRKMMNDVLRTKEVYAGHFIKDLFEHLDIDGSGALTRDELALLLDSDAFELYTEDIDELMEEIDKDENGEISYDEFRKAILEDGRIGLRSTYY